MRRKPSYRRTASLRGRSAARRGFERLESRLALSAMPLGAQPLDTGEFMLGDVAVSVVFFESNGSQDPSTENWNETHRNEVKQRIEEGLAWWQDTLALQNSVHELNFVIDYQYADNPVPTAVEPISRVANESEISIWIGDFLNHVGAERSSRIDNDVRLFNHQQRLAHQTNWAFTIFVLNAQQDSDGLFAPGGVRGAFSIAGGAFMALPSRRPASTIAHETAHQFWAMDEYSGVNDYFDTRGYYNTRNTNAVDENPAPDSIVTSLMSHANSLQTAYAANTSSPSSLESVGWKDSDGDGLFDVFDVPLQFSATAGIDPTTGHLRIVGQGAVGALPNQNSWGLQNSITINQLSHVEYRVNNGPWQIGPSLNGYSDSFNFSLQLPDNQEHTVEVRLVDQTGLLQSESLVASTSQIDSSLIHGFSGYVAHDADTSGHYAAGETGLAGWKVEVADLLGNPVSTQASIEPDDFENNHIFYEPVEGVTLSAVGSGVNATFPQVAVLNSTLTSTGNRAFFNRTGSTWNNLWSDERRLRIDFEQPVSRVALDAIADTQGDVAQLELYDASGNLLARYTTSPMAAGSTETMVVELDQPQAAYAVARGHLDNAPTYQGRTFHQVGLDNLQVGRASVAITNALGAFTLPFDVSGDYTLIATPPNPDAVGFQPLTPVMVSLGAQGGTSRVAFAVALDSDSWHQPLFRADINGDGSLDSTDIDTLLQELRNPTYTTNANGGSRELPGSRPSHAPHLDVNGDGRFSTLDLLAALDDLQLSTLPAAPLDPEPSSSVFVVESGFVVETDDPESGTEMTARRATADTDWTETYALAEEPPVGFPEAFEEPSSRFQVASDEPDTEGRSTRSLSGEDRLAHSLRGDLGRLWHSAETSNAAGIQRPSADTAERDRDDLFAAMAPDWDLSTDLL